MASVRVEEAAFSDLRYERLARLAGLADADHARGKMLRLWRQCTLEQTHVLQPDDVKDVLGALGVEAIAASKLGEIVGDGVRICGTAGRIEWLARLQRNGKHGRKGGRPKKPSRVSSEPAPDNPAGVVKTTSDETPHAHALVVTHALALAPSVVPVVARESTTLSVSHGEPDVIVAASATPEPPQPEKQTAEVLAVFARYRTHHNRAHPRPKSTSKEWRLIRARLAEGYTVEDLCRAVDGCHKSPFHQGENDRGAKFDSLELIMRDSSKVQKFIECAEQGPQPVLSERTRQNLRAADNWLAKPLPATGGAP